MNLIFALSTMMSGCAMLHTRFNSSPIKSEFFPSTRLVPLYTQDVGDQTMTVAPTDWLVGGIISLGFFTYSFVEYFSAIATDVLLAPLDACAVWKEHQEKEKLLKQYDETAIEPVN